ATTLFQVTHTRTLIMRTLHALLVTLVVIFTVCAAAPASLEMDDMLYPMRPIYPINRLAKRWSRLEPSIRFAGGSNAAWFV
ncbi:hypothetical protein PMAYCL1PPCAC_03844, partial [Pristionchus mayeri]